MSLLKALQEYLCEFDGMDMRPITEIKTDSVDELPSSYALAPTGNSTIKTDILGNRTYQNSYVFYAKEAASAEIDKQDNHDFLESFSDWLEERNYNGIFPVMPSRYEAKEIQVANAMLYDIYEDGTGLYQVQTQFIFEKRLNNI